MNRLLAVPLLALFILVGTASAGSAQAAAQGPSRAILVRAIGSGGWRGLPLAGARVTVLKRGQLVARGRTGSLGMALLRARRPLGGAELRVLVAGGHLAKRRFRGHMAAEVSGYEWPHTIFVDSVTTLAARYRHAHPSLRGRAAVARTRSFLRLGRSYAIGRDGRADVAFDGRRFLAAARRAGGYDAFVAALVGRMADPGAHRSFARRATARPRPGAGASLLPPTSGATSVQGVAEAISAGSGFFDVLDKTDAVLDFADAIVSIADSGNSVSKAEIEQINSKLEQIQESIGALRGTLAEIKAEAAEHNYTQLAHQVAGTVKSIEGALETLEGASRSASQLRCMEQGPPEPEQCAEVSRAITGPGGFAEEVEAAGLDTPGQLNAYGAAIGGEAVPRPLVETEGLLEAGSQVVTSRAGKLLTPAESERIRGIDSYWISSFAEAVYVAAAGWFLNGDGRTTVEEGLAKVQPTATAMRAALPEALPEGTFLDLVHSLMWPTQASAAGSWTPYGALVAENPWRFSAGSSEWVSAQAGTAIPAITAPGAAAIPYANWLIAGWVQINPLLEEIEPGPGQSPGQALLAQSGMSREIVIPPYREGARGLDTTWQRAEKNGHWAPNSGCSSEGAGSCYWPILEADGPTIGNLNRRTRTLIYHLGPYEEKEEAEYFEPIYWPWWGEEEEGNVYGNDPIANIPFLMYREVEPAQCYYYPGGSAPAKGSPGCPNYG